MTVHGMLLSWGVYLSETMFGWGLWACFPMLWFRACLYSPFYLVMFILSGLCSPCPVQFLSSVIPHSVHNVFHLHLIVSPPSVYKSTCLSSLCCPFITHSGEPCSWFFLEILVFLNFTLCLTPFEFGCIFWTLIWTLISSFACLSYVLWNESLESLCSTCRTCIWIYLFLALALAPSHQPKHFSLLFSGFVPLSDHDNWGETPEVRRVRAQVWSDRLSVPESESQLYMWKCCTVLVVLAFFGHFYLKSFPF